MNVNYASFSAGKKLRLLLSAALLAFAAVNSAQAQTYESFVKKRVSEIRGEVAAINKNQAKYKKTTRNVEDIALEGAEATFYRLAGKLHKITAEMFGETYNQTGEFYYKNGELLFAFVRRNRYDTQIGADVAPKVVGTEEQRFYFAADGRIILLLVGGQELKSGDERYAELKNSIAELSSKLSGSDKTGK